MSSTPINTKRLILAIIAAFVFVFASDLLIHGVWLEPDYKATMTLWRSEAEMQARMTWMMVGQFLCTATFVALWAKGFAGGACPTGACMYGLLMGLFGQTFTLIMYVVMPLPPELAANWFASGLMQAVLLGVVTYFVYRPGDGRSPS